MPRSTPSSPGGSPRRYCPTFMCSEPPYEIQMRAVPAAMRMEMRGFRLDVEAHAQLIKDLEQDRVTAEQGIRGLPGNWPQGACQPGAINTAQKEELLTALLPSDELARWKRTEKAGELSTARGELFARTVIHRSAH